MIVGVLLAVPWFGLFLLIHLGVMTLWHVKGRFDVISRSLLVTLVGFSVNYLLLYREGSLDPAYLHGGLIAGLAFGWLTFAALFIVYMPFFYTIATSLSVQSLVLLKHLSADERLISVLRKHFVSETLVGERLRLMVINGYLVQDGETFRLTTKARQVAGVFVWIKRFWRLGAGG